MLAKRFFAIARRKWLRIRHSAVPCKVARPQQFENKYLLLLPLTIKIGSRMSFTATITRLKKAII